ncbi:MAG: hypothetical protein QOE61_4541 [Micromonosporaceae bacterium]|jgi:hypothetical protein|nr:hypothetical protein [Micromonosporaceae bacterium]
MLSVQPPHGPQLAHGDLSAENLVGRNTHGIDAAVDVLTTIGQRVNTMLAADKTRSTRNPTAGQHMTPHPSRSPAHRAFGAPLTQSTVGPAMAAPADTANTPARPRGR